MNAFEEVIKNLLWKAGKKQIQIAQDLNITRGAVSLYMKGHSKSKRFDEWFIKNIGKDPDELRRKYLNTWADRAPNMTQE